MNTLSVMSSRTVFVWLLAAMLWGLWLTIFNLVMNSPMEAHAFVGMNAPEITSSAWINADPQSLNGLRGNVALVEFWTFGCYNCRNVEPQVKAWYRQYTDRGFVVIGVHSPEFAYEKNLEAVKRYVKDHDIRYPVAVDNDFANWNRFGNRYWPAMYLIDKQGVIRYVRVGEGGYAETDRMIQKLLAETP